MKWTPFAKVSYEAFYDSTSFSEDNFLEIEHDITKTFLYVLIWSMKYLISGNEGFLLLQREAKIIKRTFYNSKCCVLSKDVSRLWLKLAQACITLTMFNNIYFSCLFWRKILLAPSFPFWSSPWVENRRSGKKDSMFSTLVSRISYYWDNDNSIIRLGSGHWDWEQGQY